MQALKIMKISFIPNKCKQLDSKSGCFSAQKKTIFAELMEYRWRAKSTPNPEQVALLSESIRVNPNIAAILIQRGIDSYEKAEKFFRPKLEDLHNPFLMKDMDVAIRRIQQAVTNQEGMLIYGDYDVDGTTAVSIVYSYFKSFNQNIEYYIPDRYKEGYGISKTGLEYAAEMGFTLVITLDCGIRSNALADYATSLGLEMIICDHHLPGETLPNVAAILNPKRNDCEYPYKELSGAGIGFKLIQAYNEKQGMPTEMVYDYLDMVAVSIASDLVDIRGENRVLSFYGLKKLNENPSIGLQTLLEDCPKKDQYNISDILFGIGPRINAAGIISDATAAVKVLIEKDYNTAKKYAKVLSERNHERKELDIVMTELAAFCAANDVCIIAVSHINRDSISDQLKPKKGEEDKPFWIRVGKESMRGSSSLEQLSFIVLALEPEILPNRKRGRVRLVVLKNRPWGFLGQCDTFAVDDNTWEVILSEDFCNL